MSEEELIETLRTFEKNRVEQLEEPARNLFYAIMKIANERDRLNNIINKTIKYVESLSSCGRGCDIYDDIKQEILKELKGSDKE